MNKFTCEAVKLYQDGYSCSESVLRAAIESGVVETDNIEELTKVATVFSGGLSSGCLCGAISGAQIILGLLYGRSDNVESSANARKMAKEFIEEFKKKHHTTCCRALTAKYDFNSNDRKKHCAMLVEDSATILLDLIKIKISQ